MSLHNVLTIDKNAKRKRPAKEKTSSYVEKVFLYIFKTGRFLKKNIAELIISLFT